MENTQIEITDTFGGEANYSWVRRYAMNTANNATNRAIVRRAKALAGWTGLRCITSDIGETIEVRPVGVCQVMFIIFAQ
jgi:hypothetical protein